MLCRAIRFDIWDGRRMSGNNYCAGRGYVRPIRGGDVLVQYTGLHDGTRWEELTPAEQDDWILSGGSKESWRGREIREGDLLTSWVMHIWKDNDIKADPCVVVWVDKYACFGVLKEGRVQPLADTLAGWEPSVFRVIGNIHDHLGLCKEKLDDDVRKTTEQGRSSNVSR